MSHTSIANKVGIVILNWNSADDIIHCLESLKAQSYKSLEIFVVDNASTDESTHLINSWISKNKQVTKKLIKSPVNLGFGGGINLGISKAMESGCEFIGTLNPDAIANSNWLDEIMKSFDDPVVGASGGSVYIADSNTIDSCGEIYSIWGVSSPRLRGESVNKVPGSGFIFGITGGAVVYRTVALKEVGYFDDDYFMYYEDIDLCYRMQLHGWRCYFSRQAIAHHKKSVSSNKVPGLAVYNTFKNLPVLTYKNTPKRLLKSVLPRFWLLYNLMFLKAVLSGGSKSAAIRGYFSHLRNIKNTLKKRAILQSHKKVTDDYILSIIDSDLPHLQSGMRKLRKLFTGRS